MLIVVLGGCTHEEQHQELILTDLKHAVCEQPTPPDPIENARRPDHAGDRPRSA